VTERTIPSVTVFDGITFLEGVWDVTLGDDGAIEAVEAAEGSPAATLLPGFIDCHVHVGLHSADALTRGGVTSALDLGWPLSRIRALATQRGGAQIRFAGPILTAPGGYPIGAPWAPEGTGRAVTGAQDAMRSVAELLEAGASLIKVAQEPREGGRVLDDATLHAIVAAAHEAGVLVASHVGARSELARSLDAGVDVLAHGLWSDEPLDDALVDRMRTHAVSVIPTMRIAPSPARRAHLASYVSAGIEILYGTDLGNPPTTPGIDVLELEMMRAAGMSLGAVLASATALPALRFGWSDRGRIMPGLRADLVLVDGDPRDDLAALSRILGVWVSGERIR
jgi:imidazolonepropionase-like amidohydrolase